MLFLTNVGKKNGLAECFEYSPRERTLCPSLLSCLLVCGTVSKRARNAGSENAQDTSPRIVGGKETRHGSAPYMARIRDAVNKKHLCGATILDQEWILTAAHCIRYKDERNVTSDDIHIYLGDHDSSSDANERHLKKLTVAEIIIHDDYNDHDLSNDIAIIRISRPLMWFTDYIRPICLPPEGLARHLFQSGNTGRVTGWGQLLERGAFPSSLNEVKLPFVTKDNCQATTHSPIPENVFCAGYYNTSKDACDGDSGGPYAMKYKGRWYQMGIVSSGDGCAKDGKYAYYTEIPRFLPWLRSKNVTVASAHGVDEVFSGNIMSILAFSRKSSEIVTVAVGAEGNLECYPNREDAVVEWYMGSIHIAPGEVITLFFYDL